VRLEEHLDDVTLIEGHAHGTDGVDEIFQSVIMGRCAT